MSWINQLLLKRSREFHEDHNGLQKNYEVGTTRDLQGINP